MEYPSRGWAQLAAVTQEELTGARSGQGECWQLGLRRQKEMRQAAVSLSVLFLFATGRVVLCLVGVHAVFLVLALTFNQY